MISKSNKLNKHDKKHTTKKHIVKKTSNKIYKKKAYNKIYKKKGGAPNDFKVDYYYGTAEQKNLWKQYEDLESSERELTDEEELKLEELRNKYSDFEQNIKYTFGSDEEKKQWKRLQKLSEKNVSEKLSSDEEDEFDDLEEKFTAHKEIVIQKLKNERSKEDNQISNVVVASAPPEPPAALAAPAAKQEEAPPPTVPAVPAVVVDATATPAPKQRRLRFSNAIQEEPASTVAVTANVVDVATAVVINTNTQEDKKFISKINENINKSEESTDFKNTVNGIVNYLMEYKFNKNDNKINKNLQKEQVVLLMYYFNLIINSKFDSESRLRRFNRLKIFLSSTNKDQPNLDNDLKQKYLQLIEKYKDIHSSETESEKENNSESESESESENDNESDNDNEIINKSSNKNNYNSNIPNYKNNYSNEENSSISLTSNKSIIGLLSSISMIAILLGTSMK